MPNKSYEQCLADARNIANDALNGPMSKGARIVYGIFTSNAAVESWTRSLEYQSSIKGYTK